MIVESGDALNFMAGMHIRSILLFEAYDPIQFAPINELAFNRIPFYMKFPGGVALVVFRYKQ